MPDSRTRLADARLYLCTDSRSREGDLVDFLDAVLAGGVDIVQLREKGLEAADEIRFLEVFAAAAERHGALFAANDRADVALAVRAPILHLGLHDLPVPVARRIIGDEPVIGRSTHARDEFDAGQLESGVDYVCAGPTWATPTKPGRPAAGLELLRHATRVTGPESRPWFAIGGIESVERLNDVIAAGAGASSSFGRSPRQKTRARWREHSRVGSPGRRLPRHDPGSGDQLFAGGQSRMRQKCPTGPRPEPSG